MPFVFSRIPILCCGSPVSPVSLAAHNLGGDIDRSTQRRSLILPCAEEWDSVLAAAQTHHAGGSLFTPHRRRPAPEMLHIGAAEHDVDMGPGLIEEDVDRSR